MSDLFNDLNPANFYSVIVTSFIIGAVTSIHCLGMCGGLVLASSQTLKQRSLYQLGRLISYIFMAIIISMISSQLKNLMNDTLYINLITILLAFSFIYIGLARIIKFRAVPINLGFIYQRVFKYFITFKNTQSFFVGMASILLPCSFIYFYLISILSLVHFQYAIIALFFFWLPTALSLVFISTFIQKALNKLAGKSSEGILFIFVGLFTLAYRFYLVQSDSSLCF